MKNQNENKSDGQNLHFKRATIASENMAKHTQNMHKYTTLSKLRSKVIMHRFSQSLVHILLDGILFK